MHAIIIVLLLSSAVPHDLRVTVRDAENGATIRGATVRVRDRGAVTGRDGTVMLHGVPDTCLVLTRMAGYVDRVDTVVRTSTVSTLVADLTPRTFTGADVTVTAARHEQTRDETPVLVTVSDGDVFRAAQAVSLSEGLSFQPGLRLENDCQNCGFTQVRLNGLQGPYTQILIDSRPVFSSLTGVYGLEQIPAAMIDRIEVIRGAGSAMYGAGAIAGTINVITRDPLTTSASISGTTSWLNMRTPDASASARGTWVTDDLRTGLTMFGALRERAPYDHNGDTYSELPLLRNTSGGLRLSHHVSDDDRVTVDGHWIREFRRGGNMFTLPPHEADIAEQLDHATAGGSVSYEHAFDDGASRFAAYTSVRTTDRASYYGGTGGDPAMASEAALYYGTTSDIVGVGGVQLASRASSVFGIDGVVTAGLEFRRDHVNDAMPGYARSIDQRTDDAGAYAQLQLAPASPLSVAVGARFDMLWIDGTYAFDASSSDVIEKRFAVVNPRLSVIGRLSDIWQLRASYASGFRGPQAFDEDLHISTLQGAARLIRIDPGLVPERSHSITFSLDGNSTSPRSAVGLTVDGFATLLQHPFVTSLTADSVPGSPASIALKTNGDAAWVAGVNLEFRYAAARIAEFTAALTLQDARYTTAQVLAEGADGAIVSSPSITRTPNVYGSITATTTPFDGWAFDASAIVTGPMWVVNERRIDMVRTPWFVDINLRAGYDVHLSDVLECTISAGLVNLLNAYQRDLEVGPLRDAAFIYGPIRPRMFTFTVSLAWQ
jgi:outer membrane receptor for ferrienterochelin and colicins